MNEQLTEAPGDDVEHETVLHKEPDAPDEILTNVKVKTQSGQSIRIQPLNVRLNQLSSEDESLMSPDFCLQSSSNSSAGSHGGTASSPGKASSSSSSGISDPCFTGSARCHPKSPFIFPAEGNRPNSTNETVESLENNIVHKMERVEITDELEINQHEWVASPKQSIEAKGFHLGIQPGKFYEHKYQPSYYVELPHRSYFEVIVKNKNKVSCDLDLYVNGKWDEALRIPPDAERSIDGPRDSKYKYRIFRSSEAIAGKKVNSGDIENGHVKAVFTPAKIESGRLRAVSEPSQKAGLPDCDLFGFLKNLNNTNKKRATTISYDGGAEPGERSPLPLDLSRVSEAVVIAHGKKKRKKNYSVAQPIETDPNQTVVLQLRLLASLDEEIAASDETSDKETVGTEGKSYCVEPPTIPSIKKKQEFP